MKVTVNLTRDEIIDIQKALNIKIEDTFDAVFAIHSLIEKVSQYDQSNSN